MGAYLKELSIATKQRREVVDITDAVRSAVRESGVKEGLCLVYTPHTTVAIIVNEHESGLLRDILSKVSSDFPDDGAWLHNRVDNNASAHLASTYLGNAKSFIVTKGGLLMGTWQSILAIELDGPRSRKVYVRVMGD